MKRILIIFIFFASFYSLYPQFKASVEPLAAYKSDGLWHFLDTDGNEMFAPKGYLEVLSFNDGLFRVKLIRDDIEKWAFVDTKGKIVFEIECYRIFDFSEGLALVMKKDRYGRFNYRYGFVDKSGKTIIPIKYIDGLPFSEGLAYVQSPSTAGFIDRKGKWKIKLDTLLANSFKEGLAPAMTKQPKFGYINKKGEIAIGINYDEAHEFSEGLAFFHNAGYAGYLNAKGDTVIKPRFYDGKPFKQGVAFVGLFRKGRMIQWGLVNKQDSLIAYFEYSNVKEFSQGLAAVEKDGSWGYINLSGEYVIYSEFTSAGSFFNGLAWGAIEKEGKEKYGFINPSGDFVIELKKPEKVIEFVDNSQVF